MFQHIEYTGVSSSQPREMLFEPGYLRTLRELYYVLECYFGRIRHHNYNFFFFLVCMYCVYIVYAFDMKFIVILHFNEKTFHCYIINSTFPWQLSFGRKTHLYMRALLGTVGFAKIVMW